MAIKSAALERGFGCTYYPPLFVFNQRDDLETCVLRPGNVHSADGWERSAQARRRALPTGGRRRGLSRGRRLRRAKYVESESVAYAIRLHANQILKAEIALCSGCPAVAASPAPLIGASAIRPQIGRDRAELSPSLEFSAEGLSSSISPGQAGGK